MKKRISSSELPRFWAEPDNSRLTAKQLSIRLPVHVAAKIFALEEMYQGRTRTQIIGDLLSCALADVEAGLTSTRGEYIESDEECGHLYRDVGEKGQFLELEHKHMRELEAQLGNTSMPQSMKAVMQGPAPDDDEFVEP